MHRRDDPFPIRSETRIVQMMEVGAVRMRLDCSGRKFIKAHALSVVVHHIELWILLRKEADDLAVWTPERLARRIHQLLPVASVDIHHPEAANGLAALAFIHRKTNLRAIG